MPDKFEKTNHFIEFVKNIITIPFYIFLFIYIISRPNFDLAAVGKAALDKWTKDYVNADRNLQKDGNRPRISPADSAKATQSLVAAAKVVEPFKENGSQAWVYIGYLSESGFLNDNFSLGKRKPQKGDVITAKVDVFKRKDLPVQIGTDEWKFGEIKGVVEKGESVKIDSVYVIPNDVNYYGRVVE